MTARFKIIYADPPWRFQPWSHRGDKKGAVQHYGCMSLRDICNLKVHGRAVSELAENDAALFLWVVQPMLPEALRLVEAWGFTFRTVAFAWVKMPSSWSQREMFGERIRPRLGLGYHTRSGMEQCWLAIRGKGYKRIAQGIEQVLVEQVLFAPLREHSRKPDEIADRIVRLTGDVSRIELFARGSRPGWTTWGDENQKFDQHFGEAAE